MITIDAIKINIREFRDKLVRRTLTMGMIVKALDNIEKDFEEYVHLKCEEIKELKEIIDAQHKEMEIISQYRPKDVEHDDFYVKFKDALPELIAGRRFRDSYPCGDDFQTLNEFVECSSFYILKILKGKVDLEPLDEVSKVKLKKIMSYEQT